MSLHVNQTLEPMPALSPDFVREDFSPFKQIIFLFGFINFIKLRQLGFEHSPDVPPQVFQAYKNVEQLYNGLSPDNQNNLGVISNIIDKIKVIRDTPERGRFTKRTKCKMMLRRLDKLFEFLHDKQIWTTIRVALLQSFCPEYFFSEHCSAVLFSEEFKNIQQALHDEITFWHKKVSENFVVSRFFFCWCAWGFANGRHDEVKEMISKLTPNSLRSMWETGPQIMRVLNFPIVSPSSHIDSSE